MRMKGSRNLKFFRDGIKSAIDGKNGEDTEAADMASESPEFPFLQFSL